ncbi:AraC family transcriptional regulator [Paenibacillus phyllosphaerae]|nr:AraC family transcriptional regulator [Paenibacillus phyllosphaerae]
MNRALAYIEAHLTEDIQLLEAARIALCSEYHFKRMFSMLAGIPIHEYIRRRRLTLAALELQGSDARVIDVAMKYGYLSPDAFTRAFWQLHGITPSEARHKGQPLKAFPRMSFQLTIRGGSEMNFRIVEKDTFRIVGLMKRVPIIFNGVNPEIASMWQSLDEPRIRAMKELSDTEPNGLISASTNFSEGRMEENGELDHYIGVVTTKACPEPFAALEVSASTWAVFTAVGSFPSALQDVWGRIYSEWFPSASYELAQGPEMLWNESKDTSSPNYKSEIWIPVIRKPQP